MKIWAISDLHLPANTLRTMDQFGEIWKNHPNKIFFNWKQTVSPKDIVLVGGDITWATKLPQSLPDLLNLKRLPGKKKILVKGNHDHWWKSYDRIRSELPKELYCIEGNAILIGDHAICGGRGWVPPNDPYFEELDRKTFNKEMVLLEKSLQAATDLSPTVGIHALLHFPPFTSDGKSTETFELLKKYGVLTCTFGHFHMAQEWKKVPQGSVDGIDCFLTASDYLNHRPKLIWSTPAV